MHIKLPEARALAGVTGEGKVEGHQAPCLHRRSLILFNSGLRLPLENSPWAQL